MGSLIFLQLQSVGQPQARMLLFQSEEPNNTLVSKRHPGSAIIICFGLALECSFVLVFGCLPRSLFFPGGMGYNCNGIMETSELVFLVRMLGMVALVDLLPFYLIVQDGHQKMGTYI